MPIKIPAPYIMPWMIRALRPQLPGAIWEIPNTSKKVALTFDDGPGRFTPALLDVLKAENVSATFFVVGSRVERYPDILRRAHQEGHRIGIHTYRHRKIKKMSEKELREDMALCKKLIRKVLDLPEDPETWFFRPPHGSCNRKLLQILDSENMHTVMFGIVPGVQIMPKGWQELPELTCQRVLREVKTGSIIALHDGEYVEETDNIFDCNHAAETAGLLIRRLKDLGFGFTIPTLHTTCPFHLPLP